MTMPAGKYWVGDLCYVMHDEWNECCSLFFKGRTDHGCNQGEFNLADGRRFVSFNTRYGDGYYKDEQGRGYGVDAGLIGCILASDVNLPNKEGQTSGGHVIDFPRDFECYYEEGKIHIGHVIVDTDPEYEEEDDYEYEEN